MSLELDEPIDDVTTPSTLQRLRPLLVVAGLCLGVVGLVGVALLWTGGDDAGPGELDDVVPAQETTEEPEEDDLEDEVAEPMPVVTYEIYLARDPFDPVVPEPVDDTTDPEAPDPDDPDAPDPDDPDAPDPDDPDAPDPDDPVAPDPDDPDAPDPDDPDRCVGDEEVVCNGEVVSLLDITTENGEAVAVVQVDTTVYEVRAGETFAQRYRLLSIDAEQVSALFGDSRFTLHLGERVMK